MENLDCPICFYQSKNPWMCCKCRSVKPLVNINVADIFENPAFSFTARKFYFFSPFNSKLFCASCVQQYYQQPNSAANGCPYCKRYASAVRNCLHATLPNRTVVYFIASARRDCGNATKKNLVADTQLYKRLCPSVRSSVHNQRVEKWKNKRFRCVFLGYVC